MTREDEAIQLAERLVRLLFAEARIAEGATPEPPAGRLPERRLLTVAETCEVLGFGRTKVGALIKSGELDSVKIGRSRRVPLAAIDQFIEVLRQREK